MIALLCPSKGRPEKCARMVRSAYSTTSEKIQIFVAVSEEDFPTYRDTIKLPESDRIGLCMVVVPEGMPTGFKWNMLAELAMNEPNKFFMLAADDMIFSTPDWDKALVESYNGKPHVYHLLDSRNASGTPHPIVTREYINAMGYFLPPIFLHWFVDSWTVDIGRANGCFTHLNDYQLIHDKPSDKKEYDATHNGIRFMGWRERDKWVADHSRDVLEMYKARLAKCLL